MPQVLIHSYLSYLLSKEIKKIGFHKGAWTFFSMGPKVGSYVTPSQEKSDFCEELCEEEAVIYNNTATCCETND